MREGERNYKEYSEKNKTNLQIAIVGNFGYFPLHINILRGYLRELGFPTFYQVRNPRLKLYKKAAI